MKVLNVKQGSAEWLMARAGIPTASELSNLLTPQFAIRKGQMPETFLSRKVAEAWQGGPLPTFQSGAMDNGHILEGEAIPWYSFEFDVKIDRVGFITTDDGRCGCSPDGIIDSDCGIEIKCPEAHTHTRYILDGTLPEEYAAQVHGSMFVTGFKRWKFLSYRRNFPPLILTIERDEKIQTAIRSALELFFASFDKAMADLEKLNGGKPARKTETNWDMPPLPEIKPLNYELADAPLN